MFGLTSNSDTHALELLKRDHAEVDSMFKQYEDAVDAGDKASKAALAAGICDALTVHATVEEEIFYPAVRRGDGETRDLVDEAAVEHQSLKDIIGRLQSTTLADPLYDAGVKVLSEYVKHHVKEEEDELFPMVGKMDIDLEKLGAQIQARKLELEDQLYATRSRGVKRRRAA